MDFLGVVGADAPPLDSANVGNRLLQNLGWTPGTGLGPTGEGLKEPVVATARPRRLGLGGSQTDNEGTAEGHSHATTWVRSTMPDSEEDAGAAPTTADLMQLLSQMAADNKREREARLQREIAANAREAELRQTMADQQQQMHDLQVALDRFQLQRTQPPPLQSAQGPRPAAPAAPAFRPNLPTRPTPFVQPPVFPPPAAPPISGAALAQTSGTNPPGLPIAPASEANQRPPPAAPSTDQHPPAGGLLSNQTNFPPPPPPTAFSMPFSDTGSLLNPAYVQHAGQNAPVPSPTPGNGTGAITGQALDQVFGAPTQPTLVETITPLDVQSQLSNRSSRGKSRNQGRGRTRAPSRRPPKPDDEYDDDDSDDDTGEEGDGYERNRERRERPGNSKHLNMEKYSRTNKERVGEAIPGFCPPQLQPSFEEAP